ncbi:MAG: aminoglycoside phosphotransferase family protein [Chloroflexota bacterium]|nr:aminoglycoside phosphotransferase family protein [Chloroflexota bacterium]
MPSAAGYTSQVVKEHRWLPYLAAHLPIRVPQPLELGQPGLGYPFAWSIGRWLDGQVLSLSHHTDSVRLARDLAAFLVALRRVPTAGGPSAGPLTLYRGTPLEHYVDEARRACRSLSTRESVTVERVLDEAVESRWKHEPVWFHGDIEADNVLLRDGRLHAMLDFGCAGVGDPACDLVIAFTWFDRSSREVFRKAVEVDDGTWRRARGWAVWKAAITLADSASSPLRRRQQARALAAVLDDARELG